MSDMKPTESLSRRDLLQAGAGSAASLGLAPLVKRAQAGGQDRPNIVLIMTDQQSADMMSCAGNPHLDTPAMDSLAARGTRFERACCSDPVCLPSRFSMLTGLMPSAAGYTNNASGHRREAPDRIRRRSLGWVFREAGYETAYAGKVHLPRGMNGRNIGFEYLDNNRRGRMARTCADYIEQDHDDPFLLVSSLINPHDICFMAIRANSKRGYDVKRLAEAMKRPEGVSEDEFYRKYCPPLPDNFEIPEGEPEAIVNLLKKRPFRIHARRNWSERMWRWHRWTYARLTEMVDRHVGVILQALRRAGLQEDTVVAFVSDHGDMDAAHRMEHKTAPYEEAVRVPLIISYPGETPSGQVDDENFVSTGLDLLPTLCDYAGIEPPDDLPGRSVRPLAAGEPVDSWRDQVVSESSICRMLRTDRWKYCVYHEGEPREQLNDKKRDPGEMRNLAVEPGHEAVLDEMRGRMARWMERVDDKIGKEYVIRPGE